MGAVSTSHSCQLVPNENGDPTGAGWFGADTDKIGSFFEGDAYGIVASCLSLAMNFFSTLLVGYKAWSVHLSATQSCNGRMSVTICGL